MANEFKHKDPGTELTQAEYITTDGTGHIFDCQATGDILYASSTTVLKNLGKGAANTILSMGGSCIPAWTASPTIGSTSWANANHAHAASNSGGTLTTVGALDAGSITSGFGTIDTGASAITTTGLISGGSLDIDNVLINGTTIGHTCDTDLLTLGNATLLAKGTVTVGVDGTGHDVKLFGCAAGAYMEWDESANLLDIRGATAAGPGYLKLTTGELTVVACDVLGQIEFQAPLEADCSADARLVAAKIAAVAQGTFGNAVNATDLIFYTGHSETATEKFRFTSQGEIGIAGANYGSDGQVLTSTGCGTAVAWECAAGGPTEASQAQIECQTAGALFVPPDLLRHNPGVVKGYGRVNACGILQSGSFNITSVTDTDTGDRDYVFTVAFGDTAYTVLGMVTSSGSNTNRIICGEARTACCAQILVRNGSGALEDQGHHTVFMGNQ